MQVTEKMLLDRVEDAIGTYDGSGRAAILEVAAWIQENSTSVTGQVWAAQLEMEANR
jgi:hypothetical protein